MKTVDDKCSVNRINAKLATANRSRVGTHVTNILARDCGVVDPVKVFV